MLLFAIIGILALATAESPANKLPKHQFPCGRTIPSIGFSTKGLKNDVKSFNTMVSVMDGGYRVIETAYIYNNTAALGLAIRQESDSRSAKRFNRKEVFIIGKVWNTAHERGKTVSQIKYDILRDLELNQLDAGLLHWPTSFKRGDGLFPKNDKGFVPLEDEKDKGYLHAYRGLEAAFLMGLIGHIGVSNANIHQLKQIFDVAFIRPVILEVECHPLYRNEKLIKFAKDNNMVVLCQNPLRDNSTELTNEPVLKELADKYKKSVAQVALRWSMQSGHVVLPRPHVKHEIREYLGAIDFELEESDLQKINGIKEQPRTIDCQELSSHPDYPFGSNADE